MLRLILAAVGVTAAIILAPTVDAQICDKHGTGFGHIYITACAVGPGGSGGEWHYDAYGNKVDGPEPEPAAP